MKKVNVTQTQRAQAKQRCAVAMEDLEQLRATSEMEKEFKCSVSKPDWDEEDGDHPGGFRHHSLRNVQDRNKHDADSNQRHNTGAIPGRGPDRGRLLAAIQGQGGAGGRRHGSPSNSSRGGLISNGGLKAVDEDAVDQSEPVRDGATEEASSSNENLHYLRLPKK